MSGIHPGIRIITFGETFCQSTATVFSQALGALWSVQLSDGDSTDDGAEGRFTLQLSCSGDLTGNAAISLRKEAVLELAQKLLAEETNPVAEITNDHQKAVEELFRQVSETTQTALSAQFGEVKLQLSPIDSSTPDGTMLHLVAAEGARKIHLVLRIMPELADALSAPKQDSGPRRDGSHEVRANINLALLLGIDLKLTLRFGRSNLTLDEVLALSSGAVIELDRQIQEPVDLLLGDRLVATGDVVVIDENYGLRVNTVEV